MSELEVTSYEGCIHALKQLDMRQSLYDEAAFMMGRSLVNLHGKEHRARRNTEAIVFRKDVFLHCEKHVLPRTLAETLAPYLAAGKGDLVEIGYHILMNLTVDFAGIDRPERTAEETGDLLDLLMKFSLAPALGQSVGPVVEQKKATIREAMAEFDERFLKPSLRRRRALWDQVQAGELAEGELPQDVLMELVKAQEKLEMSEEELLQEGIFFTMAGAHTSIHSLSHAVHELLEWLKAHPEDAALLRSDPFFIQRCAFESVRLHPSSPVAKRRALCPVSMLDGTTIDEGDEVVINLREANRNPALFGDDPGHFNPHRQLAKGQLPYGASMGHGMHACLGRNLAIGVEPKDNSTPEGHQYGTLPLIVEALLKCGIQQDPAGNAAKDETVTRITWAHYPVVFKPEEALI